MNRTIKISTYCWLILFFNFSACISFSKKKAAIDTAINLDHFNHLYQPVELDGEKAAIVHIYSEYPNYEYAIEPSEGFTCVDDVARAMVLFAELEKAGKANVQIREQLRLMTQFVLFMQNENGYFNNFIWHDLSINTTYKTTIAELNWWSLRALWALETVYPLLKNDPTLAKRINQATSRLIQNVQRDLPIDERQTEVSEGLKVPTWLPQKYAGDQAAMLILGLLANYERTQNPSLQKHIEALAEGIMLLQKGSAKAYPYCAFMSWNNLWHAWGNSQAYTLLKAGQVLDNQSFINAALKEINYFYPYLLKNGLAEAFWIKKENGQFVESKRNSFPQIAYGIRPMVWAALEAGKVTKDKKYFRLAEDLADWLSGDNIAQTQMYQPETGRCFDGIISPTEINRNSGAESTIESLLTLIRIKRRVH